MKSKFIYVLALGAIVFSGCNSSEEKDEDLSEKVSGQEYKLDASTSQIRWFGEKLKNNEVVGSHNGTLKLISGNILLDNKRIVGGTFEIDMNTILEESKGDDRESSTKLIRHLKSDDFFDTGKYPTATVTIIEGDLEQVKGTLKMRDAEMEFTAPINITFLEGKIVFAGVFDIDVTPLGIPSLGGSGEYISPKIGFRLYLELLK